MNDHEGALQRGLRDWLRGDPTLQALVGAPARIWDTPPADPGFPFLTLGPSQSRPLAVDGAVVEHRLTVTCVSLFRGVEEARAVNAAVRAKLDGASPPLDGVRLVSLHATLSETFYSGDRRRVFGRVRVRAVTDDI